MWEIILRSTGKVLASGFATLKEADAWHDEWLDARSSDYTGDDWQETDEEDYPAVNFVQAVPYFQS